MNGTSLIYLLENRGATTRISADTPDNSEFKWPLKPGRAPIEKHEKEAYCSQDYDSPWATPIVALGVIKFIIQLFFLQKKSAIPYTHCL